MTLCCYPECTRPALPELERCAAHAGAGVGIFLCVRGRRRRPVVPAKASPQLDLFKKGGSK